MKEFFNKYKFEILVFVGTVCVSLAVFLWSDLRFGNDDQFILHRYIENISLGNGFVYNIGEKVLGSTTPLFTLIAAFLVFICKGVYIPTVVAFLNIFLIASASVFFYRIVRIFIANNLSLLGTLIFALNLSKVVPEGMESALFIFVSLGFVYCIIQERYYYSAIFLSLAILTRPDAGLIAVLALIYWYRKVGFEKTVRLVVTSVAIALPWLIFATLYFGSFIPQSLLAKLHTNDIVHQSSLQAFKVQLSSLSRIYWGKLFDPEHIPLQILFNLLPLLAFVGVFVKKKLDKDNWILVAIPGVYFIGLSISNPVMFGWYITQLEPFWLLISFIGFAYMLDKISNTLFQIMFIALILIGPSFFWTHSLVDTDKGSKVTLFDIGSYLKNAVKEGDKVGVNNIGLIGFASKAYIFDFFGLVTPDSPAFYPVLDDCRDKNAQYIIPPRLIEFASPDWLVTSGDNEMVSCFKEGMWFKKHYVLDKNFGGAKVYKKR